MIVIVVVVIYLVLLVYGKMLPINLWLRHRQGVHSIPEVSEV